MMFTKMRKRTFSIQPWWRMWLSECIKNKISQRLTHCYQTFCYIYDYSEDPVPYSVAILSRDANNLNIFTKDHLHRAFKTLFFPLTEGSCNCWHWEKYAGNRAKYSQLAFLPWHAATLACADCWPPPPPTPPSPSPPISQLSTPQSTYFY